MNRYNENSVTYFTNPTPDDIATIKQTYDRREQVYVVYNARLHDNMVTVASLPRDPSNIIRIEVQHRSPLVMPDGLPTTITNYSILYRA